MSHRYKIVLFPDDATEELSVDVVPSAWISTSQEHGSKVAQFPTGPFNNSDIKKLHQMVKNLNSPEKSWPLHRVTIHGRTRKFFQILTRT